MTRAQQREKFLDSNAACSEQPATSLLVAGERSALK